MIPIIPLEKLGPWVRLGRVEESGVQKGRWRPVLKVPFSYRPLPSTGISSKTRPEGQGGWVGLAREQTSQHFDKVLGCGWWW